MKKIYNKKVSVFIFIITIINIFSMASVFAASTASGNCGENVKWEIDGTGKMTISGNGEMLTGKYESWNGWKKYRDSVKKIEIKNGVINIGYNEFHDFVCLEEIKIPKSITSIGDRAFEGCKSLNKIYVDPKNEFYSTIDGVLFNKNQTILKKYPIAKNADSYVIPNSVKTIFNEAFEYCDNLRSITITKNIKKIGQNAFNLCENLEKITVDSNNLKFSSKDGILFNKKQTNLIMFPIRNKTTTYRVPDSVKSISEDAFDGCNNLISVTVPGSVKTINRSAFQLLARTEHIRQPCFAFGFLFLFENGIQKHGDILRTCTCQFCGNLKSLQAHSHDLFRRIAACVHSSSAPFVWFPVRLPAPVVILL